MILQLHNSKGSRISHSWEFPDSPVVSTQCFHCWSPSSIPALGTEKKKKSKSLLTRKLGGDLAYYSVSRTSIKLWQFKHAALAQE